MAITTTRRAILRRVRLTQIPCMKRPLPHERLIAYQKAAALYEPTRQLTFGLRRRDWHLADQLLRAISSVALNIAEGATEVSPGDKARFFRMAIRSAGEAAAAMDLLQRSSLVSVAQSDSLRTEFEQVMAILITLCHKLKRPH
jgi:four helix bundle protein